MTTKQLTPEPLYCCPCKQTTRHVPVFPLTSKACVQCGTAVPIVARCQKQGAKTPII